MKKLLTWISAFTVITGGALAVVSCGAIKRFKDVTITDQLAQKIIAGLSGDKDFNFDEGDVFYKLDFKNLIIDMLNQIISGNKYSDSIKDLNDILKINSESDSQKKSNQVLDNIATIKMFTDYTQKRYTDNTDATDLTYKNHYPLNPYDLMKNDKSEDQNTYAIYYKETNGSKSDDSSWLRWQTTGEFDSINGDDGSLEPFQVPDINLLTNSSTTNFRIGYWNNKLNSDQNFITSSAKVDSNGSVKNSVGMNLNSNNKINWYSPSKSPTNTTTPFETNGSGIMKYRFMYYFKTAIESKMFANLLGNSYVDSNLFITRQDQLSASQNKILLNGASRLISDIQSNYWQPDQTTSNTKMVWAFSVSNSKKDDVWNKIKNDINFDGTLKQSTRTLKSIYDKITNSNKADMQSNDTLKNDSKQGTDPFFGMSGFNGFVKNDSSTVKSLSGDLKISDDAKKAVASAERPMILTNDQKGYSGSAIDGDVDFVFVLPVYLNDLFSSQNLQIKNNNGEQIFSNNSYTLNILKNTWTNMNDKYSIDNPYYNSDNWSIDKIDNNGNNNVLIANNNGKWYVKLPDNTNNLNNMINITYKNKTTKKIKLTPIDLKDSMTLDITNKLAKDSKNSELFGKIDKDYDKSDVSYDINLRNYSSIVEKQNEAYLWSKNVRSSTDIKDLSKESKQTLLDQLESITSSASDVQDSAKTELYSEYLKTDNIKYEALYDEIKKYIQDDKPILD